MACHWRHRKLHNCGAPHLMSGLHPVFVWWLLLNAAAHRLPSSDWGFGRQTWTYRNVSPCSYVEWYLWCGINTHPHTSYKCRLTVILCLTFFFSTVMNFVLYTVLSYTVTITNCISLRACVGWDEWIRDRWNESTEMKEWETGQHWDEGRYPTRVRALYLYHRYIFVPSCLYL